MGARIFFSLGCWDFISLGSVGTLFCFLPLLALLLSLFHWHGPLLFPSGSTEQPLFLSSTGGFTRVDICQRFLMRTGCRCLPIFIFLLMRTGHRDTGTPGYRVRRHTPASGGVDYPPLLRYYARPLRGYAGRGHGLGFPLGLPKLVIQSNYVVRVLSSGMAIDFYKVKATSLSMN